MVAAWVDLPAVLLEDEEARPVSSGMIRLRIVPPDETRQGGYFANYFDSDGIVSIQLRLGSYVVGRVYDLPKTHIDTRNLLQNGFAVDVSSEAAKPDDFKKVCGIQAPRPKWLPLHLGPVHFRALFDEGTYKAGTPLEKMASWFQQPEAGCLGVDEATAAIVIKWNVALPNGQVCRSVASYYGDGPHQYEQHQVDETLKSGVVTSTHFPAHSTLAARNLFCGAVSLRSRLTQEFRHAVAAKLCIVHARVGSAMESFQRIPPDVFHKYRITSWGCGAPGGGEAELEGQPKLFAIHLEAASPTARDRSSRRQLSASQKHIDAFKKSTGNGPSGIKELDDWRREHAPNVSRESLRALFRAENPDLKPGPRGPRTNSTR